MQETKQYPKVVQQIHNEFYSASEKLLAEAKQHLNKIDVEKVDRLKRIGFTAANEVVKHDELKVSDETRKYIEMYSVKYPNNKFIDKSTVEKICKKYKLICAPIDRYKGFVPKDILPKIEGFEIKATDKKEPEYRITNAWSMSSNSNFIWALKVRRRIGQWVTNSTPGVSAYADRVRISDDVMGESTYVDKFEVRKHDSFLICAPSKDMDTKGLSRFGYFFQTITTVTYPDPVVLAPVKGGYLIVAAWGDEASDELVINQKNN